MSCTFQATIVAASATVLFVTPMAVAAPADRIIHGGPIVTVNPTQPNAEAVAIASGRIVAVGSETDVMKHKGEADERITPLEALEAITIDGARLYGEEAKKGSIEVGKLADLVVLSANPLTVPPATLRAIRVEETLKDGKTVWKRSQTPQER
jgi:predicted amidohydrolase YtcJ